MTHSANYAPVGQLRETKLTMQRRQFRQEVITLRPRVLPEEKKRLNPEIQRPDLTGSD